MATPDLDHLPLAQRIAVGYCPAASRQALEIALLFDHRLSQIVARTSEPMLGQMRLAWWREVLQQQSAARPQGDAVLDAISQHWQAGNAPLIALVDGWEHLIAEPPLATDASLGFAEGRAGALLAACGCVPNAPDYAAARACAQVWALADLAAKVSNADERAMLVGLGIGIARPRGRLAAPARGLAVLGALGKRALDAGGQPLMHGRGAALAAVRAAFFRR